MKTAILGYSGSGKSTLARKLGEKQGAAVLHFDSVQFLPNWEIRPEEEKRRMTEEFLDAHDAWVIDGTYSKLFFERRMEEADRIILMLFGRFSCLARVIRRYRKYKNTTRPDMAEGCREKIDAQFVAWVLFKGRSKKSRERFKGIISKYGDKVVVIRNQRQLDAFYKAEGLEKD